MDPVNLYDFEAAAKERLPLQVWEFIKGGAGDELTLGRNRTAFDEITVNPRFLVDVSRRDLSTTVLGTEISFPVMIAPAGLQRQVHPEGERATAMAAGSAGTLMALSAGSGYSVEEVAEVATGPLWLQLYHLGDDLTIHMVTKAKNAGFGAICLTVDVPVATFKDQDRRNRFVPSEDLAWANLRDYPGFEDNLQLPTAWSTNPSSFATLTWERLDWLRALTGLPLVIKGIRTVEDARRCVEHGVDAIVVSTHGGRQLDSTLSSIESLPPIVEAVGDRLEVYLDSGVRRGMDVLKALALGARAVLIGRPFFWGLAVDGEAGVCKVLETLRLELDRAMAYCGRTSVAEIDRSLVSLPSHWQARV